MNMTPRTALAVRALMARRTPLEFISSPANPDYDYLLAHDVGINTFDFWWVLAMYRGVRLAWLAPLALLTVLGVSVWGFIRLDERGQLLVALSSKNK